MHNLTFSLCILGALAACGTLGYQLASNTPEAVSQAGQAYQESGGGWEGIIAAAGAAAAALVGVQANRRISKESAKPSRAAEKIQAIENADAQRDKLIHSVLMALQANAAANGGKIEIKTPPA